MTHEYEDFLRRTAETIEKEGFVLQTVLSDNQYTPDWIYTIGLEKQGRPEYLMVGFPGALASTPLLNLINRCGAEEQDWPKHGDSVPNLLQDPYRMAAVEIDPLIVLGGAWFNVAHNLRGRRDGLAAIQLVWPYRDGAWPKNLDRQPILGEIWW